MKVKKDIENVEDVHLMVDTFYAKVRANETIGVIFNTVIKNEWAEHIEKLTRFWQTVLLNQYTYQGAPFQPHSVMPLKAEHFNIWVSIFHSNIDEHFEGPKAEEAKIRATNMAKMFENKIAYIQENNMAEHNSLKEYLNTVKS